MIQRLLEAWRRWRRLRHLLGAGCLIGYFEGLGFRYGDPVGLFRAARDHPAGVVELVVGVAHQDRELGRMHVIDRLWEIF